MTTSDTPRTDAFCDDASNEIDRIASSELVGFAKALERDNNALREQLADTKRVNEILEQHVDDARHNEYEAQSQLAEKEAALAVCTNALALYANGKDIYQDERIADYAAEVLANLPESAKQYARVIEAAGEYEAAITALEKKYGRKDLELTQYSTLLPLRNAVRRLW